MKTETSIKVTDTFKKELYDEFVSENPNTSIFQTLDIADVYNRDKSCTSLILVAIDEDTGEIVASLLAKILEEKPGFLSSFSKHSSIRGGPIFVNNEEGIEAVSLLLQHYTEIVKKDALYSRIYPLTDASRVVSSFRENGYEYEGWQNFLVDLKRSKEELWSDLKKDKKRAVTKAKNKGVEVQEIIEKGLLYDFYDLVAETYKIRKTPLEDIGYFEAVFDVLVPKNMAKFFVARYEEEYIAARLVLTYNGIISDWHVGASRDFLSLKPNDLLVWHILEWGSKNGFHTFDFGGAGELGETSGWVEFKKRFGGKLVNYGRYTKVHKPKKLWASQRMFQVYRKIL